MSESNLQTRKTETEKQKGGEKEIRKFEKKKEKK